MSESTSTLTHAEVWGGSEILVEDITTTPTPAADAGGNAIVGIAYALAPAIAVWAVIIYMIGHLL